MKMRFVPSPVFAQAGSCSESPSMYSNSPTPHSKYWHSVTIMSLRNDEISLLIHLWITCRVRCVSLATTVGVITRFSRACFSPMSAVTRFFTAISVFTFPDYISISHHSQQSICYKSQTLMCVNNLLTAMQISAKILAYTVAQNRPLFKERITTYDL